MYSLKKFAYLKYFFHPLFENSKLKIHKNIKKRHFMEKLIKAGSPFIGEKIKLRIVEKTDLEEIMKYWNSYESRMYLGGIMPMSSMLETEWIDSVHQRYKNGSAYFFTILEKETDVFLGTCGLEGINNIARSATLGIGIHNPENHDKGYGTDTMRCLLKIGFDVLNLNRIELMVMEFNPRGIHVYEKVGFKKTGIKRQGQFLQGSYHDIIIMDILKSEYDEMK